MKLSDFISTSHLPAGLIRAVVRQMGGWESFTESAQDIANRGADGSFHGFIYYVDTCAFTRRQKANILTMGEQLAGDIGESLCQMIAGFNCLRSLKLSAEGVARQLYSGKGEDVTQIYNALAWFALEETARSYADMMED